MNSVRTIEVDPAIPPIENRLDVVRVVIPDEHNNLLLIQRSPHCSNNPGLWEFPGGKIDSNMSPEHTATNEILEEIDLVLPEAPRAFELVYRYTMKNRRLNRMDKKLIYCGWSTTVEPLESPTELRGQESEVQLISWMSESDIRKIGLTCLTPMAQLQLKKYKQQYVDTPPTRHSEIVDLISIAA